MARWRTPVRGYVKGNGVAVRSHEREVEARLPSGNVSQEEAERLLFEATKPKRKPIIFKQW